MLGLHKARRRKAALAIVSAGAVVGLAMSPAFAAETHAEAEAQAIKGSGELLGQIFQPVLDGGTCKAVYPGSPDGAPAEKCGDNLTLGGPTAVAYTQEAKANSSAQSGATATVAPVALPGLGQSIDLTNIIDGLGASNSSQVLNGVTGLVAQLLTQLGQAGLQPLYDGIDSALNQALDALSGAVEIEARIGAVEAQCTATPTRADGNGTVAGIDIVITLANDQEIIVPIPVGTDPNTPLLVSVPDLVDDILLGITHTLEQSLDGALAGLGTLTETVRTEVVAAIMEPLTPALEQLADGLAPILTATVNKQVDGDGDPVSHTVTENDANDPKITVTALDAILLDGTPLEGQLELAKVSCGKNIGGDNGGGPGLQFDKEGQVEDGDAKFTLRVKNPTGSPISNIFVQDFYGKDIDAGDVKDVKVSQGTFNKNTGRWDVGTLGAGQTAKLTFKVETDDDDLEDGIKNAACVNKATKPGDIQKNDGLGDDTDGCDEDTAKKDDDDSDDSDDSDGPKSVDSGLNDGGNLGPLAISGLLAASALVGSAARQRLLLDR